MLRLISGKGYAENKVGEKDGGVQDLAGWVQGVDGRIYLIQP